MKICQSARALQLSDSSLGPFTFGSAKLEMGMGNHLLADFRFIRRTPLEPKLGG